MASALHIIVLAIAFVAAQSCYLDDEDALFLLKEYLGNPTELSSWVVATDCCTSWKGIVCSNGRVSNVTIENVNAGIDSEITPRIDGLSSLKSFTLNNITNLTGEIPATITELTNLSYLAITYTNFSGEIPVNLGDLSSLEKLYLGHNNLSGSIPSSLGNLSSLTVLGLDHNQLSGSLPSVLPESLQELYLNDNNLSGSIPSSLGNLLSLTILELQNNELNGSIPESVGNLKLTEVDLSSNRLDGSPSPLFGEGKPTQKLNISHNGFLYIMSLLSFPLNLTDLDVSYNWAIGHLPSQINGQGSLNSFNVSHNLLFGEIPQGVNGFDRSAYEPNLCLCGFPLDPCPCCLEPVNITENKLTASKTAALFPITK